MLINVDKLIGLCNFFKEASLEEDMAKRIMLSVIPAAMSKSELGISKGFDYKALKSAANGVKDLVKYGTKACVEELAFYGEKYSDPYYDEPEREGDSPTAVKSRKCKEKKENARKFVDSGMFREALQLCVEAFNDLESWAFKYGGTAWAKIASTLLEMQLKKEHLDTLRAESASQQRNPEKDYLSEEVETMKEIIVLMNIFDGLAHNTASVMPKVVDEEIKENKQPYEGYEEEEERNYEARKYQKRIQKLMDSKEIDDPYTVYKEVQHIIEQPQFKHLFTDWISRIRRSPEYHSAKTLNEKKKELDIIKSRKELKSLVQRIENTMDKIDDAKDKVLIASNDETKRQILKLMSQQLFLLRDEIYITLYYKIEDIAGTVPELKSKMKELQNFIKNIGIKYIIMDVKNEAEKENFNINNIISDIYNIKRGVGSIPGAVDQYVG